MGGRSLAKVEGYPYEPEHKGNDGMNIRFISEPSQGIN
jgi:hypothetical protein